MKIVVSPIIERSKACQGSVNLFEDTMKTIIHIFLEFAGLLNTLLSLINLKSRLPILKNSTLHKKKIPPCKIVFYLNTQKLFKLELSCKSNMFYSISQLFKYKRRGL